VLRRTAALAVVVLAATTASSVARPDARVSVYASLSRGADPPLLKFDGTQDAPSRDRYAIKGSLRGLPCPGKTYRLVVAANIGRAGSTYDATLVFRRSKGDRIACGVPLPRNLGRTFTRMQIFRKGASPGDSSIIVEGRRINAFAITGSFTTRELLCDRAYQLRVQFSSPSGRMSTLYDVSMKKVSVQGRRCA
jgi:hypothetical protein